MPHRSVVLLAALLLACRLPAATPDEAIAQLTAQVVASEVVRDAAGTPVALALSNHLGTARGKGGNPAATGLGSMHVPLLAGLTSLEALALEKQPLADADYAGLALLTRLEDVRLQYLDGKAGATRRAPLFINHLPRPLRVLEIKHCFSIDGGCMGELKPQPALEKLELDTGFATPDAVPFICAARALRNLQLHRTSIGDEELARVVAALPQLETLLLRPQPRAGSPALTLGCLREVARLPRLQHLILGLTWDMLQPDGLRPLASCANLRQLDLALPGVGIDHPAVRDLHGLRPTLLIRCGGARLGGEPGQEPQQEDAAWNWDRGVNTHG